MDDIELSKAHLVGHSLGGKVAMELALSDSAKVDRLVVMDIAPIAYPPRHDDVFAGLFAVDPQLIELREQAERILSEHIDSPQLRTFLLKNLVKSEQGFAWRMNLTDLHDQYRRLIDANREGCFDGDVLFLKGADSDYLTELAEPDIRRRFPKVKLRIVSQTGHWLHAEKPELVGKLIGQYLMP
jgi:esterase